MKKYHAMLWPGVALVAAGVARLLMPFSATIGTIHTSCGNTIAYLSGQDSSPNFAATLSICETSLRRASLEGVVGGIVGLILFLLGLVSMRRAHRLRGPRRHKVQRSAAANPQAQRSPGDWERPSEQTFTPRAEPENSRPQQSPNVGPSGRGQLNPEMYEQVMRIGRMSRPRTVLSFFGVIFAALVAGSVVAISLFAGNPDLSRYIPYILVFDAIVAIVLIIGVFVTITKDPARLMLSEITNQNAVALQQGRRQSDVQDPVTVRRIVDGDERREGVQYGRRWNDPKS